MKGYLGAAASFVQQHSLAAFLASSVGLGSLATWLLTGLPANPGLLPLLAIPISYLPAIFALLLVRLAGSPGEQRAFRQRLSHWRVSARWYAAALFLLPGIAVSATALATLWGGGFPFHPGGLALLPLFLITNLGEEIGWRGYALPRLQTRFNSLTASVLLGVAWAAFHWVALWQNPAFPWLYVTVGSLNLLALSVVMTWMFNRVSGSIPILTLTHAAYDVVSFGALPIGETSQPLLVFALGAALATLLAVGLVLAQGVELGNLKDRAGFPQANTNSDINKRL